LQSSARANKTSKKILNGQKSNKIDESYIIIIGVGLLLAFEIRHFSRGEVIYSKHSLTRITSKVLTPLTLEKMIN
jgi:hypothetical protein